MAVRFGVRVGRGVEDENKNEAGLLVEIVVLGAVGSGVLVEVGWAAEVEQATDIKINIKIKETKGFRVLRCIYPP